MHHPDDVGTLPLQLIAQPLRVDCASPLDVDAPHLASVALEHLRQPITEVAGDDHDAARAIGDGVRHGGFHGGGAGARGGDGEGLAVGAEDALQGRAHFVEHRDEVGIEMAEYGRGHRAHDARGDQARARAEQNAFS